MRGGPDERIRYCDKATGWTIRGSNPSCAALDRKFISTLSGCSSLGTTWRCFSRGFGWQWDAVEVVNERTGV
jgi:hypothetical protein